MAIQIITLVGMLVYSYYRIEMRIIELEDKVVVADSEIEQLLAKHEFFEESKRLELEEQLKFYEKEFNINPSWGKKEEEKMIKLKDLLNERMYGKQLNDKWYPAHSREPLSWSLTHDYVPLYPKTMESIIGKVPIVHFMSQTHHTLELFNKFWVRRNLFQHLTPNKSSQFLKVVGYRLVVVVLYFMYRVYCLDKKEWILIPYLI